MQQPRVVIKKDSANLYCIDSKGNLEGDLSDIYLSDVRFIQYDEDAEAILVELKESEFEELGDL